MRRLLAGFAGVLALALVCAAPTLAAEAPAPWWWAGVEVTPSNLPPESEVTPGEIKPGEGTIIAVASNLGAGTVNGAGGVPVAIVDKLPGGLKATAITGQTKHGVSTECVLATLRCTYTGVLYPDERLAVTITVKVEEPPGTVTTLPDEVSVQGGGAPHGASRVERVRISGAPTSFGVQEQGYELAPYTQGGAPANQAGSHPFQLTSTLVLDQTGSPQTRQPAALPRNLRFALPLGLVGDPQATEECSMTDFTAHKPVSEVDLCPPGSVVGVASVTLDEPHVAKVITLTVPLFNLAPSEGEPARFGFEALGLVPVIIDTSVGPGGDYGVLASVRNVTAIAGLLSSQVSFWGVPGDPIHNQSRGWECVAGGLHYEKGEISTPCPISTDLPETPLLTLPTSCPVDPASEPFASSMAAESWTEPGDVVESAYRWSGPLSGPLGLDGCGALPFEPQIQVSSGEAHGPAVRSGSTPTGLSVDVKLPQGPTVEPDPEGLAEADVRETTVALPEGVQLNPSAANGLQACPETQSPGGLYEGVGFEGFRKFYGGEGAASEPAPATASFSSTFRFTAETLEGRELLPSCPPGSKVGVVHIKTPLLPSELEGALYLAEPAPNGEAGKNPFDSLIALYLVGEDKQAGVLVKLAGEGRLNPVTGRITTSFENTPQLPFEELRVELFGGQRASVGTPAFCGVYASEAQFTPWSVPLGAAATVRLSPTEGFTIVERCSSGGPLAFSPAFDAQSLGTQAGAFTSFSLQLERPDGQQALTGVSVHLPPGVAALLSTVTPCSEPPVGVEWSCGEASLIGHSTAWSGLGDEPVMLGGDVYLTSGYDGAPFGILVRTLAQAGPFDLGWVNVRSRVNVNPETAAVTIATDPGPRGETLPTMLKGIPVQLKRLQVTVDRHGFEFNPTSCEPMRIEGTLTGSEGASAGVSSGFQIGGCESLPFSPELVAGAVGHGSKAEGTTLKVTVRSGGTNSSGVAQAGIAKVDLQLPKQLSSRLPTLQKACVDSVFIANPAGCDPESVIGYATIHTPVLTNPLTGPAYLVSHGGAAFPDVEFVLQGEGITLLLDGKTDIKGELTYSRFESTPDAPFTTFETVLPAGPHGVLTPNVAESKHFDLCGETLEMPTTIVAHNGATIERDTQIAIEGCTAVKSVKVTKLTRAQQLANALKACQKKYKRSKTRRVACEKQARKRYAVKKASLENKAHKTSVTPHHHD